MSDGGAVLIESNAVSITFPLGASDRTKMLGRSKAKIRVCPLPTLTRQLVAYSLVRPTERNRRSYGEVFRPHDGRSHCGYGVHTYIAPCDRPPYWTDPVRSLQTPAGMQPTVEMRNWSTSSERQRCSTRNP